MHCLEDLAWPFPFHPEGRQWISVTGSLLDHDVFRGRVYVLLRVWACKGWQRNCYRAGYFLRSSAFLQIAAFCLFVSSYFWNRR